MKHHLFKLSLNLVALCLKSYGWTRDPRPAGYPENAIRPFWRYVPGKPNQIETASFPEAVAQCIDEARKSAKPA